MGLFKPEAVRELSTKSWTAKTKTCNWIISLMATKTQCTIRNLVVASIYILNPMRMQVLNKMPISMYQHGRWEKADSKEIYIFTVSAMHKTSSTWGPAKFLITPTRKEMLDCDIMYYRLTTDECMFASYTANSCLSKYLSYFIVLN